MEKAFEEAIAKSKTLSEKPSNDVLLKLYGLYKQATDGDVQGERPGGFDFKGAAKFDAWASLKGKSTENAAHEYIDFVNSLF
jgi:diazepam-binding inhibitor (GABA receptor modulating acyl-CoA-binding protein)